MSTQKGRNVRVEVGITEGSTDTVTAISKANPGVASATAHGNANGVIGYLTGVEGMTELEGQAVAVDDTATDAFDLEGIDTTNFGTFTDSCVFTPISAWATLSVLTQYEIPNAEADQLDVTTLLDNQKQSEAGMLAAQNVTFSGFSDPQLAAMAAVEAAARDGELLVFKITFPNGERRVFRGQPSLPGESVSVSQMATAGFGVTVKGRILKLPAVS